MNNILVLGSGGREHALVWKLRQSNKVKQVYCIPGNGGISDDAIIDSSIKLSDIQKIYHFIISKNINLVVIGPEQPLVDGVVDYLISRGIKVFGALQKQAHLEGSKVFAKEFMLRNNIPTAKFVVAENYAEAKKLVREMFEKFPEGVVIKADGLAAGKGVVVCDNIEDANKAIELIMQKKCFGSAGERVVIEQKLSGVELSVIAFCDGKTILPLTHSQDHKRVFDEDKGPNTGGMGAFSPVPFVSKKLEEKIYNQIMVRFLEGVNRENLDYNGVIYFGLMITDIATNNEQPYVLEFNCRFGDPETQVVLPLLENDLYEVMVAVVEKRLEEINLKFYDKTAVCVVLSSKGYPSEYETGKQIFGFEKIKNYSDVIVFHSGTKKVEDKFYTSGGRVLGVTALGKDLRDAIDRCYSVVKEISFDGMHLRKDIGQKGLMKF